MAMERPLFDRLYNDFSQEVLDRLTPLQREQHEADLEGKRAEVRGQIEALIAETKARLRQPATLDYWRDVAQGSNHRTANGMIVRGFDEGWIREHLRRRADDADLLQFLEEQKAALFGDA